LRGPAPSPPAACRTGRVTRDVRAGRTEAVERFWLEAETRGGPLVEAIDGNDQEVLVTFLWKELFETHNVLAIWPGPNPQDYFLTCLPGTNVWYETVRVRRGSRFSYSLAPNNRDGDRLTAQRDPLNPRMNGLGSVLETPGAPDETWYRKTPPVRGTVTPHHLQSALLQTTRDILVYTPSGHSPSTGPYPLVVLFDGDAYANLPGADDYFEVRLGAPNTFDNLIAAGRIRPAVVAFVSDNRSRFRAQEEDRRRYARAMATELVPWLAQSFAVSTSPHDVVVGGYSGGAGAAIYVALHHPEVFGNALLQSGGGSFIPLIKENSRAPVRFYLDSDSYGIWGWAANQRANPVTQLAIREALESKGYDVTYRESGDAHESTHWAATLADGLTTLLGAVPRSNATRSDTRPDRVSQVAPPPN
jgi:enterochelin esterase family protein